MRSPRSESRGDAGMIGPAATPRARWHGLQPRLRVSLREFLVGIALLAIVLAAGANTLKARHLRQRAAVSQALFQPLVQHHTDAAETWRRQEFLGKRSMYHHARRIVEHGVELVRLLEWSLVQAGSDPPGGGRYYLKDALKEPPYMKQTLDSLARTSALAALKDRKASYHAREAAYYAQLISEGCIEEGRRPLDLEVERLRLAADEMRTNQKHNSSNSEVAAWYGRMAAYYDREAAHWAQFLRQGRTDQGPRPADLEAQRRFEEAERKTLLEILNRIPGYSNRGRNV